MVAPHLTHAQKIFRLFYVCHLPSMYAYSQKADEAFGRVSTGDESYDKELAESTTYTQLNIWQIAEHFSNDTPIGLSDPTEAVEIYSVVRDLINEWTYKIERDFDVGVYPAAELKVLETFAKAIWTWAKIHKPVDIQTIGVSLAIALANRDRAGAGFYAGAQPVKVDTGPKPIDIAKANEAVNREAWERRDDVTYIDPMAAAMVAMPNSIRHPELEENRYRSKPTGCVFVDDDDYI